MRRARQDGENERWFRNLAPATWRDHAPSLAIVGILLLVGALFWATGHQGWGALLAIVAAFALLLVQLWQSDKFWRRSIGEI